MIGQKAIPAADVQKQVNREYWRYLVMALGLLLLLEWVVYHRRWMA